jgi:hypothetical protein
VDGGTAYSTVPGPSASESLIENGLTEPYLSVAQDYLH